MDTFDGEVTDEDLWLQVLAGDGRAFGVLFDRHRDRVFGHGLRLVQSRSEAEDVTAVVFLEAWRCRARVRIIDGSILGWLLVTTGNVARNHLRSRLRYQRLVRKLPPSDDQPDHMDAVLDAHDTRTRQRSVRHALAGLSARDQQVLLLCVVEGMPTADVSQLLRIPPGTVKSRLSRAKQHLAHRLAAGAATQASPAMKGESS